jgi:transposase
LIRTILSNAQWERIASELPGKIGDPGRSGDDNRLFVEGVLWVARTGAPWRDLPDEFGKWYTVYTRFLKSGHRQIARRPDDEDRGDRRCARQSDPLRAPARSEA